MRQYDEDLFLTTKFIEDGDNLVFIAENMRLLMKVNKNNGKMSPICHIDGSNIYRAVAILNRDYYCFPQDTRKIIVIRENGGRDIVNIPKEMFTDNCNNWAANYITYHENLYFYWANPVVTKYSYNENKWNTYGLPKQFINKDFAGLCKDAMIIEHSIYFGVLLDNIIMELRTDTGEKKIHTLNLNNEKIVYIKESSGKMLIVTRGKKHIALGLFSLDSFEKERDICRITIETDDRNPFQIICRIKGGTILLPGRYNHAFYITDDGEVRDISCQLEFDNQISKYNINYLSCVENENNLYTVNIKKGSLLVIDKNTGQIDVKDISYSREEILRLQIHNNMVNEGLYSLNNLIKVL